MGQKPSRCKLSRRSTLLAAAVACAFAGPARADIFQWQYANPADPADGMIQSTTLCPGGAGAVAGFSSQLQNLNLTQAYLPGLRMFSSSLNNTNLTDADLNGTNLDFSDLTGANLTNASANGAFFQSANLTAVNFTGAAITGANLDSAIGLTVAQLTSTSSYQAGNLAEVGLSSANLAGINLASQDLTEADLSSSNLTGANLTNALITYASFNSAVGFTIPQLTSTNSYQNGLLQGVGLGALNLAGINLASKNLGGADFASATLDNAYAVSATLLGANFTGASLVNANLSGATFTMGMAESDPFGANFTNANLTGANLTGANLSYSGFAINNQVYANLTNANLTNANLTSATFGSAILTGATLTNAVVNYTDFSNSNLTLQQLASTSSYKTDNLQGITLVGISLAGFNLSGQNLTSANLGTTLTNANLTNAIVADANFTNSDLTPQQLASTASFQSQDLHGIVIQGADLTSFSFTGQNLTGADFTNSNLSGVSLKNTNLTDILFGRNVTGTDFTNATITGAGFFASVGFTAQQLVSTASYQSQNLQGVSLFMLNLPGVNLAGQNLTNANLNQTNLNSSNFTNANLTGAFIAGTDLGNAIGLTPQQITSTASFNGGLFGLTGTSFANDNLTGINLTNTYAPSLDLAGANLSKSNLTSAYLVNANMANARLIDINSANANLTGADMRGATSDESILIGGGVITANVINPNGQINGPFFPGPLMTIHNYHPPQNGTYSGAIQVVNGATSITSGELQFIFDGPQWNSTITFAAGNPVSFATSADIDLEVDPSVNPASLLGISFPVFKYNGVTPTGTYTETTSLPSSEFLWSYPLFPLGTATLYFSTRQTRTWTGVGDGSWAATGNWTGGTIPQYLNDVATFGPSSAPSTINLDAHWSVGGITFNSQNSYTIAPGNGGALSLGDPPARITDSGGSHAITAPLALAPQNTITVANASDVLTLSGPITGSGTLTVSGAGTLRLASPVPITLTSLTLSSGSTVDLTQGTLTISYGSPSADPVSAITAALATGYNSGTWTGTGITSSTAAANPSKFALGYIDGDRTQESVRGMVPENQLFIRYTLAGDAYLKGTVGFDDLVVVAQNFGKTGEDWANGNFTYDPSGSVGFADLVKVAQNYGLSLGVTNGSPAGGLSPAWQSAPISVPEPTALTLTLAAAALLPRRRPHANP